MTTAAKLEPMFLNPIDAALHASIELGRIQSGKTANVIRLQSILEALTDRTLRASGAIYGMTPLAPRSAYAHIIAIDKTLDKVDSLFEQCERSAEKITKDNATLLKECCEHIYEHYQAARWVDERASSAR